MQSTFVCCLDLATNVKDGKDSSKASACPKVEGTAAVLREAEVQREASRFA